MGTLDLFIFIYKIQTIGLTKVIIKIYKCESLQSVVAIHKSLGGELLKKSLVF